jgi:transcription elongation factor Elf1
MDKDKWTSSTVSRNCPLCGGNSFAVISKTMKDGINLPTVICKRCTLVFTNPVPQIDIYNRFYEEAYNSLYIHDE